MRVLARRHEVGVQCSAVLRQPGQFSKTGQRPVNDGIHEIKRHMSCSTQAPLAGGGVVGAHAQDILRHRADPSGVVLQGPAVGRHRTIHHLQHAIRGGCNTWVKVSAFVLLSSFHITHFHRQCMVRDMLAASRLVETMPNAISFFGPVAEQPAMLGGLS